MTLLWSLDLSTFCFELVYCDSFKYFWMSSLVNLMFKFDVGFMYFYLLVEVILLQCGIIKPKRKIPLAILQMVIFIVLITRVLAYLLTSETTSVFFVFFFFGQTESFISLNQMR